MAKQSQSYKDIAYMPPIRIEFFAFDFILYKTMFDNILAIIAIIDSKATGLMLLTGPLTVSCFHHQ